MILITGVNMRSKGLTDKQELTLRYLEDNCRLVLPPLRDISKHFGINIAAARYRVKAIEKKGYIKFSVKNNKSRAVQFCKLDMED